MHQAVRIALLTTWPALSHCVSGNMFTNLYISSYGSMDDVKLKFDKWQFDSMAELMTDAQTDAS